MPLSVSPHQERALSFVLNLSCCQVAPVYANVQVQCRYNVLHVAVLSSRPRPQTTGRVTSHDLQAVRAYGTPNRTKLLAYDIRPYCAIFRVFARKITADGPPHKSMALSSKITIRMSKNAHQSRYKNFNQ